MGEMEVPADAFYGASTQRAVLNFPISGQPFPRRFIRALALIKLVAAETNAELGLLDADVAAAIAASAGAVAAPRRSSRAAPTKLPRCRWVTPTLTLSTASTSTISTTASGTATARTSYKPPNPCHHPIPEPRRAGVC